MARGEPRQWWECPKCRHRVSTPLPATGVWCTCDQYNSRGKRIGKVAMALIWSKGDGPVPEPVAIGEEA